MTSFRKYYRVFITAWQNGFIYRLNFIMWRVRMFLQLLTVYFLWSAVLAHSPQAFGLTTAQFLTYIIGASLIRALVFSGQNSSVHSDIGTGDLNNHLLRPINYFAYWFSQDLADKLLNLIFAFLEIGLIILFFHPPLVPPASLISTLLFIPALLLAIVMYYFFSLIIGLSTFWMPEGNGWPQRFFISVLLDFFSGGLFPLSILPPIVKTIAINLPTAYFLNNPLQIYLGQTNLRQSLILLVLMIVWTIIFWAISRLEFKRGLKIYGAYGR